MIDETPLVSIGIPTYNRMGSLVNAIESALAQEYSNIELIISDNASTDQTEAICKTFASHDSRVRYIRQERNQGPTSNFNEVFRQSSGKYFMWLGDDDWIDPHYVGTCLESLMEKPSHSLVAGIASYYKEDVWSHDDMAMQLMQESATSRVIKYYAEVGANGIFYGLMRKDWLCMAILKYGCPLRNVVGADWLLVAAMAYAGKIETLTSVRIHRRLGGVSENHKKTAASMGLSFLQAHSPHLMIAHAAAREIIIQNPIYHSLSLAERYKLAVLSQARMLWRHLIFSKSGKIFSKAIRVLRFILPQKLYVKIKSLYRR